MKNIKEVKINNKKLTKTQKEVYELAKELWIEIQGHWKAILQK